MDQPVPCLAVLVEPRDRARIEDSRRAQIIDARLRLHGLAWARMEFLAADLTDTPTLDNCSGVVNSGYGSMNFAQASTFAPAVSAAHPGSSSTRG
jgi:hypothetical protein